MKDVLTGLGLNAHAGKRIPAVAGATEAEGKILPKKFAFNLAELGWSCDAKQNRRTIYDPRRLPSHVPGPGGKGVGRKNRSAEYQRDNERP
jgi:hypothetical protein